MATNNPEAQMMLNEREVDSFRDMVAYLDNRELLPIGSELDNIVMRETQRLEMQRLTGIRYMVEQVKNKQKKCKHKEKDSKWKTLFSKKKQPA